MRTVQWLAVAVVSVASLPLLAQQIGTNAQQSTSVSAGKTQATSSSGTSASSGVSGGQANANSDRVNSARTTGPIANSSASEKAASAATVQMKPVKAELQSKLNSKTAKAGDPVIVMTTEKVTTAEGALIPKGTRLIGHVLSAQARTKGQEDSQITILFERAEIKGGGTIVIHSIIEGLAPSQRSIYLAEDAESNGGQMATGPMTASGGMAGGSDGNVLGGAGRVMGAGPSTLDRAGANLGTAAGETISAADQISASEAAQMGLGTTTNLSPQVTALPGVMLTCGSGTASSGVLTAKGRNVELDFGTRLLLGITAQK